MVCVNVDNSGSGVESDSAISRKKKKKKRAVLGSDDESMSKSSASEAGGQYRLLEVSFIQWSRWPVFLPWAERPLVRISSIDRALLGKI